MKYIHKLKLQDAEEWKALQVVTVDEQDQQAEWLSKVMTIVEVGTITKPATFDEEGNELTQVTVIEGWHVDVLAKEIIEELREYCLDHAPNNPAHGYDWADRPASLVLKEGEVEI